MHVGVFSVVTLAGAYQEISLSTIFPVYTLRGTNERDEKLSTKRKQ